MPVIGADSGAIPSVIGPGGWVVPEADPRSLARLFDRIAGSPPDVAEKGLSGRRNVEDRFTFEAIAQILRTPGGLPHWDSSNSKPWKPGADQVMTAPPAMRHSRAGCC